MKSTTHLLMYLLAGLLLFTASNAQAEEVFVQINDKLTGTADYFPGDSDKPLIITQHGFLQTRNFATVKNLADYLKDSGFPVLSPTMTLGVNLRRNIMSCEAIHLNNLWSDVQEIQHWIDWAKQRGHQNIALVGHSTGAMTFSAYMSKKVDPAVKKIILTSLIYFGDRRTGAYETAEMKQQALAAMKNNTGDEITEYSLSYCKNYPTTARNFLSYYQWSAQKVIDTLRQSTTDFTVVMGNADQRMIEKWLDSFRQNNIDITMIDGADHFYAGAQEFDLHETVESILLED